MNLVVNVFILLLNLAIKEARVLYSSLTYKHNQARKKMEEKKHI